MTGPTHALHRLIHSVSKPVAQVWLARSAGMAARCSYGSARKSLYLLYICYACQVGLEKIESRSFQVVSWSSARLAKMFRAHVTPSRTAVSRRGARQVHPRRPAGAGCCRRRTCGLRASWRISCSLGTSHSSTASRPTAPTSRACCGAAPSFPRACCPAPGRWRSARGAVLQGVMARHRVRPCNSDLCAAVCLSAAARGQARARRALAACPRPGSEQHQFD